MGRGGAREGSGRKPLKEPRLNHTVRATQDEWTLVREFVRMVREDINACRSVIEELKRRKDE